MKHFYSGLAVVRTYFLSFQILVVLFVVISKNGLGQSNYYSNSSGNVNVLTTWGTATDGSGTQPTSFTDNNQVFNIRNNPTPTIGSNWIVSGTNSKIIVGDGINAINFTIPNTKSVDAVIDVNAQATLTNSSGSPLKLGSVSTNSTIIYNQGNAQDIVAATYGNLTLSGTGNKSMAGNITVLKTVTLNSGENLVISSGTLLTLSGTFVNNGGGITASTTSSLNINSTNGISLTLPTISLQNITVEAADTIILVGDLNLSGTLNINGTFDAGILENQVKGSGAVNITGKFITRDAAGFTGSNTSIPSISVTINPGSTIEYARAGDQAVSSRSDYKNMTFSGSGTKTLATFTPIGTVTIKDNAIVDAANKTFGDSSATNLTMTSGRFIVAGNSTKPDIAGTYSLTGGVIEFAGGTASSRQNIRSTPNYLNVEVSGINVGNSNSSTKLSDGGSFTIKKGGSYENSGDKIDGTTGTQSFTLEAGATFKTGVTGGLSGSASAALTNIENIIIDPKSTIIYSRSGNQTITPLTGGYPTLLLKGSGIKAVASGALDMNVAADSLVIDPLVVFKVNGGATANFNRCHVFIRSNVSGTGMIGEITDGSPALLNAGNVTIERFIPAKRAFRFLSSPVTTSTTIKANWMEGQNNAPPAYSVNNNNYPGYGTHITGSADVSNGFDATATNNPSLFTFNSGNQTWDAVSNTSGSLVAGAGYRLLVRGSRSVDLSNNSAPPSNTILRTTGTLKTGTVIYDVNSNPAINGNVNNYSLLGNPFASSIDWDALTKTGLSRYYYVWDPTLNTRGAYATYGNGITNPVSSQVNQNIQEGQAFIVLTTSASPSLTFTEANKTIVNRSVFRSAAETPGLSVQLLVGTSDESTNTADGVNILFDDRFAASVENEDAPKINNLDENLYILRDGSALSIEGRPAILSNDSVQLNMTQLRQKGYYLKFSPNHFSSAVTGVLKDVYLKKDVDIDLSKMQLYPFSITSDSASFAAGRFSLIFKSSIVLPITISNVRAFEKGPGIQVEWVVQSETGIERYEVEKSINGKFETRGIVVKGSNGSLTGTYSWYDSNATPGGNLYRIKAINKAAGSYYSKQVWVGMDIIASSIKVAPNPVRGDAVQLMTSNIEKGLYNIALYNNLGQKVYTRFIENTGSMASFKLMRGTVVSKGSYILKVSKGDKTFLEPVIFY